MLTPLKFFYTSSYSLVAPAVITIIAPLPHGVLFCLCSREGLSKVVANSLVGCANRRSSASRSIILHRHVPHHGAFQSITSSDGGRLYLSVADEPDEHDDANGVCQPSQTITSRNTLG